MLESVQSVEANRLKAKKNRPAEPRVHRVQLEIIKRYNAVSNLYVSYFNSHNAPDVYGREFFHAVGEILQGIPIDRVKAELFHLDSVSAVVYEPIGVHEVRLVRRKWIKPRVRHKPAPKHLLQGE